MKALLPLLLLLVTAALARADAEAEARAAIAIALAQQPAPTGQTYAEARAQALKEGLPLVVGIGYDPPQPMTPGGWLTCRVYDLPGIPGPGIIVSVPKDGELRWLDVLPVASTCHDCQDMLGRLQKALSSSSSNQGGPVGKGFHLDMQPPRQFYQPPMMMMGGGCGPRG